MVDAKSTGRSCLVTHPFNDTPSSIELSYRIFIGAYDATKDMELVTAQMAKPGGFCTLITSVRRGAWTADESCETSGTPTYVASHTSDIRYTPGGWTKVRLVVSLVPPRTLSLEIDDSKALTDVAIDDRLATYPVSLGIGLRYVQVNADTASVNLDDLVFDYE